MTEDVRFVKKPVEVEAMQFTGTLESYLAIAEWMPDQGRSLITSSTPFDSMYVNTLEGAMKAESGDWIIRGKPDIFAATYESAESASAPDRAEELARKIAQKINEVNRARGFILKAKDGSWDDVMPTDEMASLAASLLREAMAAAPPREGG